MKPDSVKYQYRDGKHCHSHAYLLPVVEKALESQSVKRIFDLGCGNGSAANHLASQYELLGVDLSKTGIAQANSNYPGLNLKLGSVYDPLVDQYGQFDAVISLEVVEHLYDPRLFVRRMFDLVKPEGLVIVSTPYHGYWKNLALAFAGKMDKHFTALWDDGHIKFWSVKTLSKLLFESGFVDIRFEFAGRIPIFAKSMIAIARRSGSESLPQ